MSVDGIVGGRYRLHEEIGSGGMGVVWRATDELLGRQVAIKRIRLDLLDGETAEVTRQRTLREARIAAQLHHPHVVTIFDVLIVEGDPWLVLEYVPSQSLSDALVQRGPLPPRDAAALGVQIADALAAAHASGISHRDIKPGNVLLSRAGPVKLTDFGISHATGDVTLTSTNLVTGTPAFLAPEVARGGQGDSRSDVYSLGATLYAAVEGSAPYGDGHENVFRLLQLVATGSVPPPQRAGVLGATMRRLMDADPAQRPSAAQARDMLRGVGEPVAPAPPTQVTPPPYPGTSYPARPYVPPPSPYPAYQPAHPARRRGPMIAAALAAVLVVAAAVVVALVVPRPATPVAQPLAGTTTPATPTTTAPTTTPLTGSPVPGTDPRTADPCSLLDPVPLQTYGDATLDVDFGDLGACQVSVYPPAGGAVVVAVAFSPPLGPSDALPGTVEIRGDLAIGREVESEGYCARTILLTDRTRVVVTASLRQNAVADVCTMAETATETAITRIADPGITQRPVMDAPNSLAGVDACSLLDDAGLATVPALAGATPYAGFANWTCTWGDTPYVGVYLSRQGEITDADGTPMTIAGREALVLPSGYGIGETCLVQVPHRRFLASNGEQRVEKLQVYYVGSGTPEELCATATTLAAAVIPKMPGL